MGQARRRQRGAARSRRDVAQVQPKAERPVRSAPWRRRGSRRTAERPAVERRSRADRLGRARRLARERLLHRRGRSAGGHTHLREVLRGDHRGTALAHTVSHSGQRDRRSDRGAHRRGGLSQQCQDQGPARIAHADGRRKHYRYPIRGPVYSEGSGGLPVYQPPSRRHGAAGRGKRVPGDRRQEQNGLRALRGPRTDRSGSADPDAADPRPLQDGHLDQQGDHAERAAAGAGAGRLRRCGARQAGPRAAKKRGAGVFQRRRSQSARHRLAVDRGGQWLPPERDRERRGRSGAFQADPGRVQQSAGSDARASLPRYHSAGPVERRQDPDRRQGGEQSALSSPRQDHPDVRGERPARGAGIVGAVAGHRAAAGAGYRRPLPRRAARARAGGTAVISRSGIALAIVAGAIVLAALSAFTVDQRQRAIVFQLGEIKELIDEPGLYFKIPLIQNVRYFDKRILTLDTPDTERFITSEKKNVLVDSFVKWRIQDMRQYYISVQGDELRAQTRLSQTVNAALREEFGKRTVHDVVSGERDDIMRIVREKVEDDVAKIGVQIVDVRIKRIELPQEVSEAVYRRMDAERKSVAADLRSQGFSAAEKIRAEADRTRQIIIAEAYRDAQRVKGEGDARAAAIYARAFNDNPEFYAFYRSLDAYRASFKNKSDVIVLDPNSEFFKYFRNSGKGGK